MKTNRLFEIIYILLNKKKVTAKELSEKFEVSIRTIYRDVDTLCYAGIPIYTTKGINGGIFIDEDYILNKTILTKEEQDQILFSLQSFSNTETFKTKELHSKLSYLFKKQKNQWIEIDFSNWNNTKDDNEKFNLLKESIISYQEIKIQYLNSNGENTIRKIYPMKLLFKSSSWYLQAFCLKQNDYRLFKLNRIIKIEKTQNIFAKENLNFPITEEDQLFNEKIHLILKFPSSLGFRVFDEFKNGKIEKQPDASYLVNIDLPTGDWLISYLLSFESNVKIIEPEYIKNKVLKKIEEIKNLYK